MSWTANLLRAARLEPGERVLVVVRYTGAIHVDMTFSAPEVEVDGRPLALPAAVR